MSLFLSMLPIYLLGNLHCMGMCGPLVMMIGRHRYRFFYFFGRLTSFTLAGTIAGEAGAVIDQFLKIYQIPALVSFLFGTLLISMGFAIFTGLEIPGSKWLGKAIAPLNSSLSVLILRDRPLATYLFGFFTIFLPCGQTILVFSACALTGSLWEGLLNGFAFALLTSPSLLLAMHAHSLLVKIKRYYNTILGLCALVIGSISIARGFAELGLIPHLILNSSFPIDYHIVFY